MNNRYFFSALCLTVLALAPACCKKKCHTKQENVKTTIELDSTVFETENTQETKQSIAKF